MVSMNQNAIIGALSGVVLLLGGAFVYTQFFQEPEVAPAPYAYPPQQMAPAPANGAPAAAAPAASAPVAEMAKATPTAKAPAGNGRQADCSISIASWNDSTMTNDPAESMNGPCTVSDEKGGGFTLSPASGGTLMTLNGERVTKVKMGSDGFMEVFIDGQSLYGYHGLKAGKIGDCYSGSSEGTEVSICRS